MHILKSIFGLRAHRICGIFKRCWFSNLAWALLQHFAFIGSHHWAVSLVQTDEWIFERMSWYVACRPFLVAIANDRVFLLCLGDGTPIGRLGIIRVAGAKFPGHSELRSWSWFRIFYCVRTAIVSCHPFQIFWACFSIWCVTRLLVLIRVGPELWGHWLLWGIELVLLIWTCTIGMKCQSAFERGFAQITWLISRRGAAAMRLRGAALSMASWVYLRNLRWLIRVRLRGLEGRTVGCLCLIWWNSRHVSFNLLLMLLIIKTWLSRVGFLFSIAWTLVGGYSCSDCLLNLSSWARLW